MTNHRPTCSCIDVHHHFSPPADLLARHDFSRHMSPQLRGWTLDRSLDDMDRAGVSKSIASILVPSRWFASAAPKAEIIRRCNEFAADIVRDRPDRFGMYVTLPLPDIDASMAELEYGLDVLGADGVCLMTNCGDRWLGDPHFIPVLAELNRRKALLFIHPIAADCCTDLIEGIPDRLVEFGADTARVFAQLVLGGAALDYPDLEIIWPHGGGVMPYLVQRFLMQASLPAVREKLPPEGFMAAARRYHYEIAQVSNPASLAALTRVVPQENIVFGTDYPFVDAASTMAGLRESGLFSYAGLRGVLADNFNRLIEKRISA